MEEAEAAEGEDAADLAEEAEVVAATVAEDAAEVAMVEDAVAMVVGGAGIIRTKEKCHTYILGSACAGKRHHSSRNKEINVKI